MQAIQWTPFFNTHVDDIDTQHHKLVDLTNQLGEMVLQKTEDYATYHTIVNELVAYTIYHFETEEKLLEKYNIDSRHTNHHKGEHENFLNYVSMLSKNITPDNNNELLEYLTRWLAYHILGTDQNFGKQYHLVKEHKLTPFDAYEKAERDKDPATEMLLTSMNGLFHQLSEKNLALYELNAKLEDKVEERTKELSQVNQKLKELARTDVLTSLPNRRHALEMLKFFWQEKEKNLTEISCIMIDADGFKEINDSFGHDAGDIVLKELAGALRNCIRTDDFISRLGGDEFLITCPSTGLKNAISLAEKIRATIAKMRVKAGDGQWHGSISIGVAVTTPNVNTIEKLIKRADEGVYMAKECGKNKVCCTQEITA